MEKLLKFWHNLPDTVKVSGWVFLSAGITAVCSWILEQPELFKYYGVANIILFAIKEANKARLEKKK